MITLEQGVELVWHALSDLVGGEIYVKKIPSMNILNIVEAISGSREVEIIGIRPGEKLLEQMVGSEDAPFTYEYSEHFKVLPMINDWHNSTERIRDGVKVTPDFIYSSDNNSQWMDVLQLREWVTKNLQR